ncbi:hypothetical protein OQA88_1171 [Cercophora sp. LCS_1]
MTVSVLSFGVEVEILVRPKAGSPLYTLLESNEWDSSVQSVTHDESGKLDSDADGGACAQRWKQADNRLILRQAIAELLTANRVPAEEGCSPGYDEWSVVDDGSVQETPGFWRIELVSRVLSTADGWRHEVATVFQVLSANADLATNESCATHIHVSPGLYTFEDDQLRAICQGIAFFDTAITALLPAHRRTTKWARSNMENDVNPHLRQAAKLVPRDGLAAMWSEFDQVSRGNVFAVMNSEERRMAWNFANVDSGSGTVEFRSPPGVTDERDLSSWVTFTLGLVAAIMGTKWQDLKTRKRTGRVWELVLAVEKGAALLGR